MKVAMIGSLPPDYGGLTVGGVAIHVAQLARQLAVQDVRVAVLAQNADSSSIQVAIDAAGFEAHAPSTPPAPLGMRVAGGLRKLLTGYGSLDIRLSLRHRISMAKLANRYSSFITSVDPDLVHIHGAGLGLLAIRLAMHDKRIPIVATVHSLRGHLPEDRFRMHTVPSLQAADTLITVSEHLRREAIDYDVPDAKIHVIPNGVDTGYFRPIGKQRACDELGIPSSTRNVLFVGHLIRRKGADILIRAFSEVCRTNNDVKLYIVGGRVSYTENSWYQELMALPKQLGLKDKVSFVGQVDSHSQPTLNWWYNAADVLVLPSLAEGMGMVLIEAMACGKPVIGAEVGGIRNVIRDGENGLLVKSGHAGLSNAILSLIESPETARRLGERGMAEAKATYSWKRVADQTLGVYRSALRTPIGE